jgi:hypothetical protein
MTWHQVHLADGQRGGECPGSCQPPAPDHSPIVDGILLARAVNAAGDPRRALAIMRELRRVHGGMAVEYARLALAAGPERAA